jgi:hypothetical protein
VEPLAEQLLARAAVKGVPVPQDDRVREKCPLLWSMLTQDTYRDGTIRVLPTIKIDRIPGAYLVTLQDHASHQQISVEVEALEGVAKALERAMAAGGDAFRPYRSQKVRDPFKRAKPRGA